MIDGGLWGEIGRHLPLWHWQRIETGGTGRGIPDVNGCQDGREVWLELKQTSGWAVDIRPEQVAWAERRARAGGRVLLLVRRRCAAGPRRAAADELWVHPAQSVRHVLDRGLRDGPPPLLRSEGGPSKWDWAMLEYLMTT